MRRCSEDRVQVSGILGWDGPGQQKGGSVAKHHANNRSSGILAARATPFILNNPPQNVNVYRISASPTNP